MQTNQTIEQVTQGIDFFNQITQSGAATALIFALVLGLGLALAAKVPAHALIERDSVATWAVYMTCILGAFVACWLLWPPGPWRPRLAFSLSIAFATPVAWGLLVFVVKLIRPEWGKALALSKFSFEEVPDQSAKPQGESK
jgi:hypothetical protein